MALTELIFGKPVRGKIGTVTLDCTVSESHADEVEITNHPVESGSTISDHIRKQPLVLELEGIITNTPVVFLASVQAESPVDLDFIPCRDRVSRGYEELRRIQDAGELVDVVTSLRNYSNMAIQSLGVKRDASSGNILSLSISLREVITANASTIDALSKISQGKVPKKDLQPSKEQNARQIMDRLGGGPY